MNRPRLPQLGSALCIFAVCSLALAEQPSTTQEWVTLFDGGDLAAWQKSPTAGWVVQDGAIALSERTDGSLNNDDYLWTKETYGNFILDLVEEGIHP